MRTTYVLLAAALLPACNGGGGDTTAGSSAGTGITGVTGQGLTTTDAASDTGSAGPTTDGTGGASESDSETPTTGVSPTSTSTTGEPTTATTTDATSTSTTTTTATTEQTSTTGVVEEKCPCPDLEVPLDDGIFVLSKTAQLWKYFPQTHDFELLGPADCGLAPSTFSMGVDREGFAWVQYSDMKLRKIDVTDTSQCSDPGFVPMQNGIENFGMAFVSNSADDKCDRIYGNHYNGVANGDMVSEFFSVDPDTLLVVPQGLSDYGLAEVTGTGDGRAFLFAGPDPSSLVEVDKATGATLEVTPLPGVKTGGGFAFAFFGGDFYFFTDKESDSTSEVTHLDYDDSDNNGVQDLKVVVEDAPLRIVGAGVSTCAPLIPQ
ncbi:hypothetical protein [Nannocystis punicea]|uniref:Uncharacterized protein n=1 Tax=Nannocystis punicea TaxID=2995304 RepID=A0ABY7HJV4_9BACT|nr:hypothetical protein [Nannocystis poenicansa]WAS99393.1 hypothetical protein O0S08_24965 [Nannocystis poenicansa]